MWDRAEYKTPFSIERTETVKSGSKPVDDEGEMRRIISLIDLSFTKGVYSYVADMLNEKDFEAQQAAIMRQLEGAFLALDTRIVVAHNTCRDNIINMIRVCNFALEVSLKIVLTRKSICCRAYMSCCCSRMKKPMTRFFFLY